MGKILGIDPSLTGTGCVYLVNGKLHEKKLIKTKPSGENRVTEIKRLQEIRDACCLDEVEMVVMEGMAFMARNTTSLMQLAGLNYLIRDQLVKNKIPFIIVAPTTLKKFISGKGNAPKDQMMMEVYKRYGVTLTNDNLCDAYALAMIGSVLTDRKIKTTKFQKEVIALLEPQLKNYSNGSKRRK
jgi:crossover junction endodeoxyribonuclease RuvC